MSDTEVHGSDSAVVGGEGAKAIAPSNAATNAESRTMMEGFSTALLIKTAYAGLDEVSKLAIRYEHRLVFKWQDERRARQAARNARAARSAIAELERRLERVEP